MDGAHSLDSTTLDQGGEGGKAVQCLPCYLEQLPIPGKQPSCSFSEQLHDRVEDVSTVAAQAVQLRLGVRPTGVYAGRSRISCAVSAGVMDNPRPRRCGMRHVACRVKVTALATYSFFFFSLFGRQVLHPEVKAGKQIDSLVPIFTIFQFMFLVGWFKAS